MLSLESRQPLLTRAELPCEHRCNYLMRKRRIEADPTRNSGADKPTTEQAVIECAKRRFHGTSDELNAATDRANYVLRHVRHGHYNIPQIPRKTVVPLLLLAVSVYILFLSLTDVLIIDLVLIC